MPHEIFEVEKLEKPDENKAGFQLTLACIFKAPHRVRLEDAKGEKSRKLCEESHYSLFSFIIYTLSYQVCIAITVT